MKTAAKSRALRILSLAIALSAAATLARAAEDDPVAQLCADARRRAEAVTREEQATLTGQRPMVRPFGPSSYNAAAAGLVESSRRDAARRRAAIAAELDAKLAALGPAADGGPRRCPPPESAKGPSRWAARLGAVLSPSPEAGR